jgi:hypothetical protein
MSFWHDWTKLNCERLKSVCSESKFNFDLLECCPKLLVASDGKRMHIQPSYFVDEIEFDEQSKVVSAIQNFNDSGQILTAAIPTICANPNDPDKFFEASCMVKRMSSYSINLKNRTLEHIFSEISSRQRTKLRSEAGEFTVSKGDFTGEVAEIFDRQQTCWGVPRINYFSANILATLNRQLSMQLWTANSSGKDYLHILLIENYPEAYFFLSAATTEYSRQASLQLQWAVIKDLFRRNFHSYHLGGGIISNDGIERFKRSLGAELKNRYLFMYPSQAVPSYGFFPAWIEVMAETATESD